MGVLHLLLCSFLLLVLNCESSFLSKYEWHWDTYEDESFLKVFKSVGLRNYTQAENFCKEFYSAQLVSIEFEEKQKFLESYLRSQNVVDNVWIGLNFDKDKEYSWSTGTDLHFNNWAPNTSPKNSTDFCVQLKTDSEEYGKWSDVSCNKMNLILCEREQLWSPSKLQYEIMKLRKRQNEIMNSKNHVQNLEETLLPIGFIYVQLPKQKSPSEMWPLMKWADVSSDYAGVFFRVEGGNSSSFGTRQEQSSPRLTSLAQSYMGKNVTGASINIFANGEQSQYLAISQEHCSSNLECTRGIALKQSGDEVRPVNMAVRIWKRAK